jgi:hypothetical protein
MMWIEKDGGWWVLLTDGHHGIIEVDRFRCRDEAEEAILYYCSMAWN